MDFFTQVSNLILQSTKYIKTMHVDISPNGEATIVLGK